MWPAPPWMMRRGVVAVGEGGGAIMVGGDGLRGGLWRKRVVVDGEMGVVRGRRLRYVSEGV